MAAGGSINHPSSVYGKKRRLKRIKKNKKLKSGRDGVSSGRNVHSLTTCHILKKTRTNPTANITLSGKKKKLLLKQLKRQETGKEKMDVVIVKSSAVKSQMEEGKKEGNAEKMDVSQ